MYHIKIKLKVYLHIINIAYCFIWAQDHDQNIISPNKSISNVQDKISSRFKEHGLAMKFNFHNIINSGHVNIDNKGELYSSGTLTQFSSYRFSYINKFMLIRFEPFLLKNKNNFSKSPDLGTFSFNNNHLNNSNFHRNQQGLMNSEIALNLKGIGFAYGYMNDWWGPGVHSSIILSTNAPSRKTYKFGTLEDLRLGRTLFSSQVIVQPYKSEKGFNLFFSGLKIKITHLGDPVTTLGFHRVFYSGDFGLTNYQTRLIPEWTIHDAVKLVTQPLFGSKKKGLSYTIPGTPGFDAWDEILSGYINLFFPKSKIHIFSEIASDDSRGNFTDLLAHWDHTLAYHLGFLKYFQLDNKLTFFGAEFLTTRLSNTTNPSFYRGDPNGPNYYAKDIYDFSSYLGRRLGAHSGSSSDDLFMYFGQSYENNSISFSLNKERHALKSMSYPEIKDEINIQIEQKINEYYNLSLNIEYEKISNFGFVENNISISRMLWFSLMVIID